MVCAWIACLQAATAAAPLAEPAPDVLVGVDWAPVACAGAGVLVALVVLDLELLPQPSSDVPAAARAAQASSDDLAVRLNVPPDSLWGAREPRRAKAS